MILRRYQAATIVLLGIVYFINLPGYTSVVRDPLIPPIFTIYTFVALILPVAYRVAADAKLLHAVLTNPLTYWCWAYLLIACLWYFLSGHSQIEQSAFKYRIVMVILAMGFLMLFSEPWSLALARKTIVAASLIAVVLNIFDFTNPGVIVPFDHEWSLPGRAAAFYINPNRAGAALIIGFLLGAGIMPRAWRPAYLALILVGIALTLSRAAALATVLGLLVAWRGGILSFRQFLGVSAVIAVMGVAAVSFFLDDPLWEENVNIEGVIDRVQSFSDPSLRDQSFRERSTVLRVGLDYFADQPLLGNGIGSSYVWRFSVSTHNMYLYFMVEYGIIGLFIFPALIWACVRGARAPARPWLLGYAMVLFVMGFFTHNATEEPFFIISYALAASMSALSRRPDAQAPATQPAGGKNGKVN